MFTVSEFSCWDSVFAGNNELNKGRSLVPNYLLCILHKVTLLLKGDAVKAKIDRIRYVHNVIIQISWTVSTWEKPDGFVSSSNDNSQRGKHSEEADSRASESDSEQEDSESEGQSPGTNLKVNSLFILSSDLFYV